MRTCPRRPRRPRWLRPGHLAVDLLLGDRWLDPAVRVPVRGSQRCRRQPRQRWGRRWRVAYIFTQSLDRSGPLRSSLISAIGQFFCSDVVHDERVADDVRVQPRRCDPGLEALWSKVVQGRVPANAVMHGGSAAPRIITLPALAEVNIGTAEEPLIVPTAFYAVVVGRRDRALPGVRWCRSGCAGGWATSSSRARGTTGRSTSG